MCELSRQQDTKENMDPKLVFPFTVNKNTALIKIFDSTYQWGYQKGHDQYLDLGLGGGAFPLGFQRQDFIDEVSKSMEKFSYILGEHQTTNPYILDLAEKYYDISGGYRSIFTISGSLAVETAVKVSKLYQKNTRKYILGFESSYHGSTYLSSSISCTEYMHKIQGREPNCRTISWDLDSVRRTIKDLGEENVSCIVVETCSWQAGLHEQPLEWWQQLRDLCTQNEIMLIIDDVALCGAKTGKFFGFDLSIAPDFICTGKSLSGGFYPLSNCLITDKVFQSIRDIWFGHGFTYGFNMSGVLSSLHYLDVIEQEDIYKGYEDVKQASTDIFNNYLNFDSVTAVRNYGTFWCLDVRLKDKTEAEIERLFFDNKIYLGIWNDPIARKQILIHTPNQVHADYFESLDQRLTAVLKELE